MNEDENMHTQYEIFCEILGEKLKPYLNKKIIIYGCSRGGDFVRWFLQRYYSKKVKAVIDRWELSPMVTIPHLWSLYYIYDEDDVIINTTAINIVDEFDDTGEKWQNLLYEKKQIVDLWNQIYEGGEARRKGSGNYEITYYDWLEYTYQIDLLTTVKRAFTQGEHAHGYVPTDFRIFLEGFQKYELDVQKDAVLDIGCGKGSGVIALYNMGFRKIGAVEYTKEIFNTMKKNLELLDINFIEVDNDGTNKASMNKVLCYCTDASQLEKELDQYNWFFLFNPFSLEIMKKVLDHICGSIKTCPRKVYIFYVEPIGHRLIMETGVFELRHKIMTDMSDVSYYSYIYESKNK